METPAVEGRRHGGAASSGGGGAGGGAGAAASTRRQVEYRRYAHPGVFTSISPAWNNDNLARLSDKIRQACALPLQSPTPAARVSLTHLPQQLFSHLCPCPGSQRWLHGHGTQLPPICLWQVHVHAQRVCASCPRLALHHICEYIVVCSHHPPSTISFVDGFNKVRRQLLTSLSDCGLEALKGTTDSEHW